MLAKVMSNANPRLYLDTVPDSIRYPLFIYKYKIAYNLQTNDFKKNLSYKFVAFSLNYNSVR